MPHLPHPVDKPVEVGTGAVSAARAICPDFQGVSALIGTYGARRVRLLHSICQDEAKVLGCHRRSVGGSAFPPSVRAVSARHRVRLFTEHGRWEIYTRGAHLVPRRSKGERSLGARWSAAFRAPGSRRR
jgi:hypothetical protein